MARRRSSREGGSAVATQISLWIVGRREAVLVMAVQSASRCGSGTVCVQGAVRNVPSQAVRLFQSTAQSRAGEGQHEDHVHKKWSARSE